MVVASSTSLPAFYAGWGLVGLAMSAILYAPAFAAITGWAGNDVHHRIRALTAVTLVAGLASTVFAPLTAWSLVALGWRATYLVMAAIVAATAAAHWGAAQALARNARSPRPARPRGVTSRPSHSAPASSDSWSLRWRWAASACTPSWSTWSRCCWRTG